MDMQRRYSHRAVEWRNEDGQRECRLCPRPITGAGDMLRHADEAIRPDVLDSDTGEAVAEYTEIGARALEDMWTDRVSDYDRARVVVEALNRCGALNIKTRRRKVRAA